MDSSDDERACSGEDDDFTEEDEDRTNDQQGDDNDSDDGYVNANNENCRTGVTSRFKQLLGRSYSLLDSCWLPIAVILVAFAFNYIVIGYFWGKGEDPEHLAFRNPDPVEDHLQTCFRPPPDELRATEKLLEEAPAKYGPAADIDLQKLPTENDVCLEQEPGITEQAATETENPETALEDLEECPAAGRGDEMGAEDKVKGPDIEAAIQPPVDSGIPVAA